MGEVEAALGPGGCAGQGVGHLRRREGVEVGDPAGGQLFAGVAVEAASGRVGIDDAAGGRVDEELDRAIALEDLAVEVVSRSSPFRGRYRPPAQTSHAPNLRQVPQVYA